MNVEQLSEELRRRGYEVDDYGVLYCYGLLMNLKVVPADKVQRGYIAIGGKKTFDKWGNSEDYVCYRIPRNTEQLDRLLEGVRLFIEEGRHIGCWGSIDVTYLLRARSNPRPRRQNVKRDRKRPKLRRRG